jgi:type I restriction enzyme R subunit
MSQEQLALDAGMERSYVSDVERGTRLKRLERVNAKREAILSSYAPRQRDFLDFVLSQYVQVGESEPDSDKPPDLLQLKYGSPADAVSALGSVADIRSTFRGFQSGLYRADD